MAELEVGNEVVLRFGPYRSTGTVTRITDEGAVIAPAWVATLVGYDTLIHSPGGKALTEDRGETFIGRAHWHTVEVVDR